jgi:hypothetical protein
MNARVDHLLSNPRGIDELETASEKYAQAILTDGQRRSLRAFDSLIKNMGRNVDLCISTERRRGKPSDLMRSKFVLTKAQIMEKAFPNMSMLAIYRRYQQIYLLTLEEVIIILLDSTTLEEAHTKIVAKVKAVGGDYQKHLKQHHSKLLQENVKVGED